MIIDRALSPFIVYSDDTILNGLTKITANRSRIVFSVSETGKLEGVLTDGDFRRWIVDQPTIDLDQRVSLISNKKFVWAPKDAPHSEISDKFTSRIDFIPLIDESGHLVAIARRGRGTIRIGETEIGPDEPAYIIAEIGNNHNGDMNLARQLVDDAVSAGANAAKFQMRTMGSLFRSNGDGNGAGEDLGAEYTFDLLSRFNLEPDQLIELFDYCKERGIEPLCTPWDATSLETLDKYGIAALKVASADLNNHELISQMIDTHRPLICSTGMSTEGEISQTVALLRQRDAEFVLLHCNSAYPAPLKDINLNYLHRLREIGDCVVGYSGHELGWSVAVAAATIGAKVIEKHFTRDRNLEGNDHRVSLLPNEFSHMVSAIRDIEQSMGDGTERTISQGELMNREVLGKSLVAARNISVGEVVTADAILVRSPGRGLPPYRKADLVDRVARREIPAADFFYHSDLEEAGEKARDYRFNRPFGVPARFHDYGALVAQSNFDLIEFHLSYGDMNIDPAAFLEGPQDIDLVVHSPELFAGDHVIDLASPDEAYRAQSVAEIEAVTELARTLKKFFPRTQRPPIVLNAGGWSEHGHWSPGDRQAGYDRIMEALQSIDCSGVEIIIQTMPPFPWHFGGQRYHNLFVDPAEIRTFCDETGMRICLDLSHSALACNNGGWSLGEFLKVVGPNVAHMHLADAKGVDGEGLQLGDGQIDFAAAAQAINEHSPQASFIPEIWQGHKDGGAGFWAALDRLEQWF